MIIFDESDGPTSDASACCGEGPAPNAALPVITGLGGGRIGTLVLSPDTAPGTLEPPAQHTSVRARRGRYNPRYHPRHTGSPYLHSR